MKRVIFPSIVMTLLLPIQAATAGLKVGDPAPVLTIKQWVKGEAYDLTKAKPGEVTIVEFWATWCGPCVMGIPHISDMQDHFKSKGVTFIGVSEEKPETVEKFLKRGFDAKMRYRVAIDDGGKTNTAWMKAAGQSGIPCAFVIKDGKIAWIGHPMDGMDKKVAELCGDKEYVERKEKLEAIGKRIQESAEAEKWDDFRAAMEDYLKLDPESVQHQIALYHVLLTKLKKTDDAAAQGKAFVAGTDDVDGLNTLAWVITKHGDFDGVRDLSLALSAAKKAMSITKEESSDVLDTYAMVLAESGKMDEAIKAQQKAVEKCDDGDERMKRELTARLEEYKKKQKGE